MRKVIGKCLNIYSEYINTKVNRLLNRIYTLWLLPRFKRCDSIIHRYIRLHGGQYICIGKKCEIYPNARIEAIDTYLSQKFNPKITILDKTFIYSYVHIGCINEIYIGYAVTISERTLITDHVHGKSEYQEMCEPPLDRPLHLKGKVVIEDYVLIGEGVVICGNIRIGHNSIIGANTVVTANVPPFSVVVGNPGRVVRTLQPKI